MNTKTSWATVYRPTTPDDLVCSPDTKVWVEGIISSRVIPNMTLYSEQAGVGKTTIAKMIANSCCDPDEILFINGSLDRSIDVIRNDMLDFIGKGTFGNNRKCIIIDEADSMNILTLAAMRAFMEEWDKYTAFIITCNDLTKFEDVKVKPILSRCPIKDLTIPRGNNGLAKEMYIRLCHILRMENVEYTEMSVKHLLLDCFPDIRKMISYMQSCSMSGTFKYELVKATPTDGINAQTLYDMLKAKDFPALRKYAKSTYAENDIYGNIYNALSPLIPADKYIDFVRLMGKYSFESGITASKEITFTACLYEIGKLL